MKTVKDIIQSMFIFGIFYGTITISCWLLESHAKYHYERGRTEQKIVDVEIFKEQREKIRKLEVVNYNMRKSRGKAKP